MSRVVFFVDGFNVFHSLDSNPDFHKYKWLHLVKMCQCLVGGKEQLSGVYYFTTYATWDRAKALRHQTYVKALQSVGVQVVFGAFRRVDKTCRVCGKIYRTFEEKQTDVNIAITLLRTAVLDVWDKAIIISGDSDLIPAVKAVKKTFPDKQVGIAIPVGRRAEELKEVSDFHIKLKEKHLSSCQFADEMTIQGQELKRPDSWK